MAMTVYTGARNGSIQTEVTDYQGKALSGQLYSASDLNLTDAFPVSESGADGLVCGRAVIGVAVSNPAVTGINDVSVRLPIAGDTAASIAGICVRTQHVQTNAKGEAAVDENLVATVLRNKRAGGRIWVKAARGNPAKGANVFVVVNSATPDTLPNGSLVTAAVASDAVEYAGVVWGSAAVAGDIVYIEMLG